MSLENFTISHARDLDQSDQLRDFRSKFNFPIDDQGSEQLYFTGHSLGLMPKQTKDYLEETLSSWSSRAVEGHFKGEHPWMYSHDQVSKQMASIVGAKEDEVVIMNTLTVNLHLALVSFYRPQKEKYKVLIENTTFPSDEYAVASQLRFHGFDPDKGIIKPTPSKGMAPTMEEIIQTIEENHQDLSLILLGHVNYLTGQKFDLKRIVEVANKYEIKVGLNLAHGAGNIKLDLHDLGVDFAVWCTYKYLNSGPGGMAGLFIHEKNFNKDIPRLEGWWGNKEETRFKMSSQFEPMIGVKSWQLSNPPALQMASLRSSLDLFMEAGMENLWNKSQKLTQYLKDLIQHFAPGDIQIITPEFHGAMLCLDVGDHGNKLLNILKEKSVIADFREPSIIRVAPVPMYNSYEDVFKLASIIGQLGE